MSQGPLFNFPAENITNVEEVPTGRPERAWRARFTLPLGVHVGGKNIGGWHFNMPLNEEMHGAWERGDQVSVRLDAKYGVELVEDPASLSGDFVTVTGRSSLFALVRDIRAAFKVSKAGAARDVGGDAKASEGDQRPSEGHVPDAGAKRTEAGEERAEGDTCGDDATPPPEAPTPAGPAEGRQTSAAVDAAASLRAARAQIAGSGRAGGTAKGPELPSHEGVEPVFTVPSGRIAGTAERKGIDGRPVRGPSGKPGRDVLVSLGGVTWVGRELSGWTLRLEASDGQADDAERGRWVRFDIGNARTLTVYYDEPGKRPERLAPALNRREPVLSFIGVLQGKFEGELARELATAQEEAGREDALRASGDWPPPEGDKDPGDETKAERAEKDPPAKDPRAHGLPRLGPLGPKTRPTFPGGSRPRGKSAAMKRFEDIIARKQEAYRDGDARSEQDPIRDQLEDVAERPEDEDIPIIDE